MAIIEMHMEDKKIDSHLIVVIPCYNEPDLLTTLDSVWYCLPPPCRVDVVVVVNGTCDDDAEIQAQNRLTLTMAQRWVADHEPLALERSWGFQLMAELDIPARQAGVGTARKIGMDWAVNQFLPEHRDSGVIVCLDADCTVERNYLWALWDHFYSYPQTPGCAIHFEHPLASLLPEQRQGIVHYELFLRYYLHGLRWSGFPHAFHTVGSSMAVRAAPYRRQGGMNRRKAGEDFYFLQKIIPLGHFSAVLDTTVFPSARISLRVPFGTGRAMADWLSGKKDPAMVYDPRIFRALGLLFSRVQQLYDGPVQPPLDDLPLSLKIFLQERHWVDRVAEIRANTTSFEAFQKRFFHGFNAFLVLKYVHFATEQTWEKIPVWQASATLLQWMGISPIETGGLESETYLERYRHLDRIGFWAKGVAADFYP